MTLPYLTSFMRCSDLLEGQRRYCLSVKYIHDLRTIENALAAKYVKKYLISIPGNPNNSRREIGMKEELEIVYMGGAMGHVNV